MMAACTEVQACFLDIYAPKNIIQETSLTKKGEKNNDFV